MNRLQKAFYSIKFKASFLEKNGDEFQKFFSEIMSKCHPGDFIPTRPWGRLGDNKNDGYLKSQRTLFQVYAPLEMASSGGIRKAINKINGDFKEALPHWEMYFDKWVFVHNCKNGLLPTPIVEEILKLQNENSNIKMSHLGYEELKQKIFTLNSENLDDLFGVAPSDEDMNELEFKEIIPVISHIKIMRVPNQTKIEPVSKEKLKFNELSTDVESLLKLGMRKSPLVEKYFDQCQDAKLGDNVADIFNKKYQSLKADGLSPDDIFTELQKFAGGWKRKEPRHEAAVLAVLAHLFTFCDIFENPPVIKQ